jgi:gag-polypeptide of LTR copia-type
MTLSLKYEIPTFTKLMNRNYTEWVLHAKGHLMSRGIWSVVEWEDEPPKYLSSPGSTTPSPALNEKWAEWKWRDEKAHGLLIGIVEDDQMPTASAATSAKDLWEKLAKAHEVQHNSMTAFYTKIAMLKHEYKDGNSMQNHIASYATNNHL